MRGCRASRGDDGQARWAMGRGCESKQKLGNQQSMRSKGEVSPPLFERSAEQYTLRCPGNPLVLPSIPQPPL